MLFFSYCIALRYKESVQFSKLTLKRHFWIFWASIYNEKMNYLICKMLLSETVCLKVPISEHESNDIHHIQLVWSQQKLLYRLHTRLYFEKRTDTPNNDKLRKCSQIIAHFEAATVYCRMTILQGRVVHAYISQVQYKFPSSSALALDQEVKTFTVNATLHLHTRS